MAGLFIALFVDKVIGNPISEIRNPKSGDTGQQKHYFDRCQIIKVIGNPISDGIVFKNELTHFPLLVA